ncbi:hypothetical protein H6P81_019946 [Aristolochia fimbriata]|uniref:Uncharacterized protein n=1 Tax=Aristolochia fimbriata TaxID=158543 RepID=A0AAV7DWC8_ARIFI|nr:hypothetical protein H6P81_019946 [Aristolochia fimbriata]
MEVVLLAAVTFKTSITAFPSFPSLISLALSLSLSLVSSICSGALLPSPRTGYPAHRFIFFFEFFDLLLIRVLGVVVAFRRKKTGFERINFCAAGMKKVFVLLLLSAILIPERAVPSSSPLITDALARHHRRHHRHHRHHRQRRGEHVDDLHHLRASMTTTWQPTSTTQPPPFCFHVLRDVHQYYSYYAVPPPAHSSSSSSSDDGGDDEIDPRYGVQKRLVPSGPNPLHN